DAGIAQCIDTRSDRQLGDTVECAHALGGNSKFIFQLESSSAAGQLDDVRDITDRVEPGFSALALNQARDVLVEHGAPETLGDGIDKLIPAQNACDVGVIEDVLGSRQA